MHCLLDLEIYFQINELLEDQKVKYTRHWLKGNMLDWWNEIPFFIIRQCKSKFYFWIRTRRILILEYFITSVEKNSMSGRKENQFLF